jgi:acyl carrier protein
MDDTEIYSALTDIFQEVFMRDDMKISRDLSAKDVNGWDSFKQIEIIIAAEEKFGIKFHTRELDSLSNVGDLVRVIASKT